MLLRSQFVLAIDDCCIVQEIPMCEHHTFGHACRARGVLEKGECAAINLRVLPGRCQVVVEAIRVNQRHTVQVLDLCEDTLNGRCNRRSSENGCRLHIVGNGLYLCNAALRASLRRIGRNGNYPTIEATKKGANELQVRGIDEQGTFARGDVLLKPRANSAGPPIQLSICQASPL